MLTKTLLLSALALCLTAAPLAAQEIVVETQGVAVYDEQTDTWVAPPGQDYINAPGWEHAEVRGSADNFVVAGLLNNTQLTLLNQTMAQHSDIALTAEPAENGLTYVHALVSGAQLEQMLAGHRAAGLELPLRAMALTGETGVVAGWQGKRGSRGDRMHRMKGHHDGHGVRGQRKGQGHGARGRNWIDGPGCTHWERDWHQNGCGHVHVHNLADWLPQRAGWDDGWHYAGWDHDSWEYIRNDGSHVWYSQPQAVLGMTATAPPVWFDAEWVAFGGGYPDRFWYGMHDGRHGKRWHGKRWRGHCGCGCR